MTTASRRAAGGSLFATLATVAALLAGCSSDNANSPPKPHYLLAIVSGNNQIATRGDTLSHPLVVMVSDSATGAPIANYSVGWGAPNQGGSIVPASTVTDGAGAISARWILGAQEGADTVQAQTVDPAKTLRIVTFVATAAAP